MLWWRGLGGARCRGCGTAKGFGVSGILGFQTPHTNKQAQI